MRKRKLAGVTLVFQFIVLLAHAQHLEDRPNIIVFLVDDMGWQDTSVPFWTDSTAQNKHFRTPNIERLAKQAYKFTDAYANPLCTPSRASLISGTNAARHKITSWVRHDANSPNLAAGEVDWNTNGLSSQPNIPHTFHATPLPKLLSEHGYYTIIAGKGHFGTAGTPGADPLNLGFERSIASGESSYPASYYGKQNFDRVTDGVTSRAAVKDLDKYHGKDIFLTEAITLEALDALDKPLKENIPFFLYLSHYAVHTPIQADFNYVQNYKREGVAPIDVAYASLVESMDHSLGLLLDFLENKSIEKNTVIIFLSDNGGVALLPPWRDFASGNRNAPLRSGKATVHEGGIRVPLLIKYPNKTDQPLVVSQYVQIEDIFSTVLDIAGIDYRGKTVQTVDGRSILPYVSDPNRFDTDRVLLWHLPHYRGNAAGFMSAIRKENWKLVYDYGKGKLRLYDLFSDISEQNDLASKYPEKVKDLAKIFSDLLVEREARFPTQVLGRETVPLPFQLVEETATAMNK